jgi:hypothetical protein
MEYIDYITLEDLKVLAEKREKYCISLYMPMQRMSKETRQNPIRLKNLLGKAEEELIALGMRPVEAGALLEPARAFIPEDPFWQHQSEGLAMFVSPEGVRTFRLPIHVEEIVVVTDRFHLKPLLSLFTGDDRYYVLALSQNEVRLFQCSRYSATELETPGMPASLADATKYDVYENQLQFHTRTPGVRGASTGRRPAIFHGQGIGIDDAKDSITEYFLQIDRSLQKILYRNRAPLVLAGVEFLFPIYQSVNSYQHLVEKGVEGNPEILKPEELQRQAWTIVEPYFTRAREQAVERFNQELGTGHASKDIEAVVPAAAHGRIDTLFVTVGSQIWGIFNPESGEVRLHENEEPGDEDLLDVAAVQTLLSSGKVYAVKKEEVPGGGPTAALFRY